jgi:hypothetical protein
MRKILTILSLSALATACSQPADPPPEETADAIVDTAAFARAGHGAIIDLREPAAWWFPPGHSRAEYLAILRDGSVDGVVAWLERQPEELGFDLRDEAWGFFVAPASAESAVYAVVPPPAEREEDDAEGGCAGPPSTYVSYRGAWYVVCPVDPCRVDGVDLTRVDDGSRDERGERRPVDDGYTDPPPAQSGDGTGGDGTGGDGPSGSSGGGSSGGGSSGGGSSGAGSGGAAGGGVGDPGGGGEGY